MVGRDVYAVGTSDESDTWTAIAELGKSLDKNDFLPQGYFVDEDVFKRTPDGSATPKKSSRRRKSAWDKPGSQVDARPSQEVSDNSDGDDEDDENEIEELRYHVSQLPQDIPAQSLRGSSSSSGQPPEVDPIGSQPDVTPVSNLRRRAAAKRRRDDDEDDIRAQLDEIRQERLADR